MVDRGDGYGEAGAQSLAGVVEIAVRWHLIAADVLHFVHVMSPYGVDIKPRESEPASWSMVTRPSGCEFVCDQASISIGIRSGHDGGQCSFSGCLHMRYADIIGSCLVASFKCVKKISQFPDRLPGSLGAR